MTLITKIHFIFIIFAIIFFSTFFLIILFLILIVRKTQHSIHLFSYHILLFLISTLPFSSPYFLNDLKMPNPIKQVLCLNFPIH
jgi:hypothetical protein